MKEQSRTMTKKRQEKNVEKKHLKKLMKNARMKEQSRTIITNNLEKKKERKHLKKLMKTEKKKGINKLYLNITVVKLIYNNVYIIMLYII